MKIRTNVMKLEDIGNDVWYRIGCSCGGGDDCTCDISFEYDSDCNDITIGFNKMVTWADYVNMPSFFEKIIIRIKTAFRVLSKGYIEMEGCFCIDSINHLDSFIDALEEGKTKMLQYKEANKKL